MHAPRSQPVPIGIDISARAARFRESTIDHLHAGIAE